MLNKNIYLRWIRKEQEKGSYDNNDIQYFIYTECLSESL